MAIAATITPICCTEATALPVRNRFNITKDPTQ